MPDTRYSKVAQETQPESLPPAKKRSNSSEEIVVGGGQGAHRWSVTVPIAALVGLAAAFAGRQSAPTVDQAALVAVQAETRADIAEMKRDISAIKDRVVMSDNATQNRLTVIEARLAAASQPGR